MRLQWALFFGAAAVGAQAQLLAPQPTITAALARRQDGGDEPSAETSEPPAEETSDVGNDNGNGNDTSDAGDESTSQEEEASTTDSVVGRGPR